MFKKLIHTFTEIFGFAKVNHAYDATPLYICMIGRGSKMNGREGLAVTAPVPMTVQKC